jgi:hypothetical protein
MVHREYMFTMEYLADTDAIPSRYLDYTHMIPLLILIRYSWFIHPCSLVHSPHLKFRRTAG